MYEYITILGIQFATLFVAMLGKPQASLRKKGNMHKI